MKFHDTSLHKIIYVKQLQDLFQYKGNHYWYKDFNDKGKRTFLYITNREQAASLHRRLLIQNFNACIVVNIYKYLMQIYFIV